MKTAKRHLITRFSILSIIGLIAFILNDWAINNPDLYDLFSHAVLIVLLIPAAIVESFNSTGSLRNSPIYKATMQEAIQLPFIKTCIAIHLILILFMLKMTLNKENFYIIIISPISLYITFAPIFSFFFMGKYVIEKKRIYFKERTRNKY